MALLIIFLTRRRTSVARASLSLLQKMEMREESVGAAKNANAEDRRSDEPCFQVGVGAELYNCRFSLRIISSFTNQPTHTLSLQSVINFNRAIEFELTSYS